MPRVPLNDKSVHSDNQSSSINQSIKTWSINSKWRNSVEAMLNDQVERWQQIRIAEHYSRAGLRVERIVGHFERAERFHRERHHENTLA